MTHASGAQDPTEARGPGDRGWFQPLNRPPAADAGGAQNGPGAVLGGTGEPGPDDGARRAQASDPQAGTGDPEDTAVYQRPRPAAPRAGSETQASEQVSVIRPAERSDNDKLPTAIQAPLARSVDQQEPDREPATAVRESVAGTGAAKFPS